MDVKKILRIIGIVMALVLVGFIIFTLLFPDTTFPWGKGIPYLYYGIYVIIMFACWAFSRSKR